jgi:hypothetical protein
LTAWMETSAAAGSLIIVFLSWLLYQRLVTADNSKFPTVVTPKNAANPMAEAIAQGYRTVSQSQALRYTAD